MFPVKKLLVVFFLFGYAVKPFAQVNLQTGSAVFSLPIFNWQDDKSRLKSIVALSYNSGNGLKVDNIASNVGQGWSLVQGGVITRIQVGEPDDQKAYAGAYTAYKDQDITKYPAGFLYHLKDPSLGCPNALTKYPTYGSQNQLYAQHNLTMEDKQLDYFTFQFNGQSGMFILDTLNGDHGIPLGDTKLKITFQRDETMITQGIRTTITSFTVTDVDGLIYKFTNHGYTKVLKVNFSDPTGLHSQTQPTIKDGHIYYQSALDLGPTGPPWYNTQVANPLIISSWYLSEIDDPFNSRKVIFNYGLALNLTNNSGADISYNSSSKKYIVISYKKSVTSSLELQSINYPDSHKVVIKYAPQDRFDFPGEKAIDSINVTYYGRYLSTYVLNKTYFILNRYGIPSTPFEQSVARLCLKSVRKIGVDLKEDAPPYIFDYYTGSNASDDFVPPPFCYSKDIWGFYNGNNSLQYTSPLTGTTVPVKLNQAYSDLDFISAEGLCFKNINVTDPIIYNAKPNFAQNGLLKEIIYPTGGSLTYSYAQNTGSFIGGTTVYNVGGVHVSQTSSADGGYSNGCSNPITTKYDYVTNGTGSSSSLWGLETPVNTLVSNNFYHDEQQKIHVTFPLNFSCKWSFLYPGILSQNEAIGLTQWQQIMNAIAPYLAVLSFISDVMDVINVCLDATPLAIVAVVLDIISSFIALFTTCPQTFENTTTNVFYNSDLNQGSPLPSQFRRVEVTESPGTIGKTVYQFTHGDATASSGSDYYALWFPDPNPTYSPKQRFAPWAYGLPYLTTVYDAAGHKIKETQNIYEFYNAQNPISHPLTLDCPPHVTQWVTACKCQVINNYSQRSDYWTDPAQYDQVYLLTSNGDMNVDTYNYFTGRVLLDQSFERVYRVSDATQFVQTETDYSYNIGDQCSTISNFEVNEITTVQSNGDVNYKKIKYPTDFNTGVLATMVQKNIVSTSVATSTSVYKAGATTYLGEKVTEFTQLADGNVKPYRTLEQRFVTPPSSLTAYSGPTTTNYANYKIPETFSYDVNDDLIGLKDEGARVIKNVYGYKDKFIVGVAVNADPVSDKIFYTSFEDGTFGGWTPTGSVYVTTSAMTGSTAFNLTGLSISAALNMPKIYTLSVWATAAPTLNSGSTLVKSGPTINGYTYYEYDVAASTATVTLSGSTTIDELRLFPNAARFSTSTYDPLIGKTSECDNNNRVTYYTYDNLGRLRFIKDESGNVVKMYEYNNVSSAKQTGCPGSFSNHLVSEIISRSNCVSGYQGGQVAYTVAANTFTSAVSQIDADIQAEIYLLTNGQTYANTNGSCSLIYYNTAQSETDTSKNCAVGSKGGLVTYTVPANTYSSIISQADANQKALDDIAANAIAYANSPVHSVCVVDNTADWEYDGTSPGQCQLGGPAPQHNNGSVTQVIKDQNPNSPTYNQTQVVNTGVNTTTCPVDVHVNPATKWTVTAESSSASGATVSMNVTCYQEGTFTFTSPTKVGTLVNGFGAPSSTYIPTATRAATVIESGRTWAVTVDTSGGLYIKLTAGTKPPSGTSGSSIIYLVFSYTL